MTRPAIILAVIGCILLVMAAVLYMVRDGGLYVLGYLGCGLFGGLALLAALVIEVLPGRRR